MLCNKYIYLFIILKFIGFTLWNSYCDIVARIVPDKFESHTAYLSSLIYQCYISISILGSSIHE